MTPENKQIIDDVFGTAALIGDVGSFLPEEVDLLMTRARDYKGVDRRTPSVSPISDTSEVLCNSCDGTGWVDDQNWSPLYDDIPQDRGPGDGKIRCGICLGSGMVDRDKADIIAALKGERDILITALRQISRMKCNPDSAINLITLTAAHRVAQQALDSVNA